jgi:predicted cupin superfamily sugar epimerase
VVTAEQIIAFLKLQPHPKEGGFFRETYRASEQIKPAGLPDRYGAARNHSTAIYYLLTPGTCSALHRVASDEVFHFYLGDPVRMLQLSPDGQGRTLVFGTDLLGGQQVQAVVPHGVWQGSVLEPGGRFALFGCTVAPGFDYADFEVARRSDLLQRYPQFAELITRLTPDG